jgi:hypothetical protein
MIEMLIERTNLVNVLLRERNKAIKEEELLLQVKALLGRDELQREAIRQRLDDNDSFDSNDFVFDLVETDRIFHIDQIKKICIDYRLRFLSSHLFKNEVPEEAISKIKAIEKEHGTVLSGFRIVAPSKHFHLKNYDDPLLFAPIGNEYYYLIHKWGNDLSPFRKMLVRPFRDMGSLLVLLAAVSLLLSIVVADNPFNKVEKDLFILLAFLFTFKSLCGVALYFFFWRGKNFNTAIWDSEYYNR